MLSLIIDERRRGGQYAPVLIRMQAANFRAKNKGAHFVCAPEQCKEVSVYACWTREERKGKQG